MDMLLGLIFAFCCILVTSEQPEHFHLEVPARLLTLVCGRFVVVTGGGQ